MASVLVSKASLFPGKKVWGIIYYKEVLSCLLFNKPGLSLNTQSTAFKKIIFKKHSSGPSSVCLHVNTRGGFVSLLPGDNGCSLQCQAKLFYLCNQRWGSALRWDKLITPSLWATEGDKKKLTPQSSSCHSCALCGALSALFLHQHNAICKAAFIGTTDIQRGKICSAKCTALANPLKSPKRREDWDDGNALWDSDLRPGTAEVSCSVPSCSLIKCECQVIRGWFAVWASFIYLVWNRCRCGCGDGCWEGLSHRSLC